MQRRSGITLVEVLVAILIMGVGMIALLTLFPLGALNIAQALKDDRAATTDGHQRHRCSMLTCGAGLAP